MTNGRSCWLTLRTSDEPLLTLLVYLDGVLRPKKKWGQNFLRNQGAVARIAAELDAAGNHLIYEIGPGEGALTAALLEPGRRVMAVEIDPDLAASLRERFRDLSLDLVTGDALTTPLPSEPFIAAGNLPYNVASPIIRRIIASPFCMRAVFMVQKEVADRFVAAPGSEHYGFFSLFVKVHADAKILMTLEPGSFFPRPKVRSSVVVFVPVARELRSNREELIGLMSEAFGMRRKTLVNNLTGFRGVSRDQVREALEEMRLDPAIRGEELSLDEYDRLSDLLNARFPSSS